MTTFLRNSCLAASLLVASCGGGQAPAEENQPIVSASADQSEGACGLLTRQQVDTVIPGNDGGHERDTSEETLLDGVEMDHCQYVLVEGMDAKFLDLLIYRAASDEAFPQIEIDHMAGKESYRQLDIGDMAFLMDMSDQQKMMVTASKGRTVIELKLIADDAQAKSEQLIELTRIVVGKI